MAAAYKRNRQEVGGRLGSQTQMSGGSQPNLAGTVNRTQVERRPAQFISATRNRLDSDSVLDGRTSPGANTSNLKRTAKSQDMLNNAGSNQGSSRANFPQTAGSKSRAYVEPSSNRSNVALPSHQGGSPNYSNISNYTNTDVRYGDTRMNREALNSSGSLHSQSSFSSIANNRSPGPGTDNSFFEFDEIRLDYLRRGKLYEDTVFLPNDASIYFSRNPPFRIDWMRAKEISFKSRQPPLFYAHGIDPYDVRQGELGDTWFVAAVACLSSPEHRRLLEKLVPSGQSFQDGWFSGIFRFKFWHFGTWKQVLVDDFLPTDRGQLIFVNSVQANEMWPALMEKAYAKLYGSYEALKVGQLTDALTDLTGGATEEYTIRGPRSNLPGNIINILFKSIERLALIGCSISDVNSVILENGLVTAHTYGVTDVRRILKGQHPVTLIRVRNSNGDRKEWRGRWSEWSPEWQGISPSDRANLGLIQRDDGEFWMDFDDFLANFDTLLICHMPPDAPIDAPRKWEVVEHCGRWIPGFSAGGRPSKEGSHWSNPQFYLRLDYPDEDEDNICSVVIQLMQVDRRRMKQKAETFISIGFNVYQLEKGYSLPLKKDYFDHHQAIANSGSYINTRQVSRRLSLAPGEYVVVPSSWDAEEAAEFYIRFFLERGNLAEYCDEKPERVEMPTPAPTPEAKQQEDTIKNFFYRVSGENMDVNAFELRSAINEGLKNDRLQRDVSLEVCRTLVSVMDVNGNGRLGFPEFQVLWSHMRNWKAVFTQSQSERTSSGGLDGRDLRVAVNAAGYQLPNKSLALLVFRFADKQGLVTLDQFLTLMLHVWQAFETFDKGQKDGYITTNLHQWLDQTLVL